MRLIHLQLLALSLMHLLFRESNSIRPSREFMAIKNSWPSRIHEFMNSSRIHGHQEFMAIIRPSREFMGAIGRAHVQQGNF